MAGRDATGSVFEQQRRYLFSLAYRLLGSVSDAEDVVQDAFLRWNQDPTPDIRSPRAYLAAIVVRLCLDQLRSG
jgi:RNA polymerase sigma-70 factor (ECF subfamily)